MAFQGKHGCTRGIFGLKNWDYEKSPDPSKLIDILQFALESQNQVNNKYLTQQNVQQHNEHPRSYNNQEESSVPKDQHQPQHGRHDQHQHQPQHGRHDQHQHQPQHGRHDQQQYQPQHDGRHDQQQYQPQHDGRHDQQQYQPQHDGRHDQQQYQPQHDGRHDQQQYQPLHDKQQYQRSTQQGYCEQEVQPTRQQPSRQSQPKKQLDDDVLELLAGYSFNANVNGPYGVELSIKQGESLILVERSKEDWWVVRNSNGDEGLVPKTHIIVKDKKVRSLPWLEGRAPPEPVVIPPITGVKAVYKPSYDHPELDVKAGLGSLKQWFCEICQKQCNSIQMWNAHINSKRHKEYAEEDEMYQN